MALKVHVDNRFYKLTGIVNYLHVGRHYTCFTLSKFNRTILKSFYINNSSVCVLSIISLHKILLVQLQIVPVSAVIVTQQDLFMLFYKFNEGMYGQRTNTFAED